MTFRFQYAVSVPGYFNQRFNFNDHLQLKIEIVTKIRIHKPILILLTTIATIVHNKTASAPDKAAKIHQFRDGFAIKVYR